MKTIELKPLGLNDWDAVQRQIERVEQRLLHRGYDEIGRGMFGRVFAKPGSKTVLKMSKQPFDTDAWFAYAQWVQRQPQSPTLPRIDKLLEFKSGPFRSYIAEIEKLERDRDGRGDDFTYVRSGALAAYRKVHRHMKPHWSERSAFSKLSLPMKRTLVRLSKDLTGGDKGWSFDLHDENVMRRPGTSQLVLTDPIA